MFSTRWNYCGLMQVIPLQGFIHYHNCNTSPLSALNTFLLCTISRNNLEYCILVQLPKTSQNVLHKMEVLWSNVGHPSPGFCILPQLQYKCNVRLKHFLYHVTSQGTIQNIVSLFNFPNSPKCSPQNGSFVCGLMWVIPLPDNFRERNSGVFNLLKPSQNVLHKMEVLWSNVGHPSPRFPKGFFVSQQNMLHLATASISFISLLIKKENPIFLF